MPSGNTHIIDSACVFPDGIYIWQPRTNFKTSVYSDGGYTSLQFGPWSGNPSANGNRIAVRALNKENVPVVFAYDISLRKKFSDIKLSDLLGENNYATISPSGRYIYFTQVTNQGSEPAYIFTVDGALVQYWPEHHRPGHGDLTIDADGHEVYVGISKSEPDKYHVIKRRLEDGQVTLLAPYGDAGHASLRSIRRPGWVFLSYYGSYDKVVLQDYPVPFYQEIIALRIDGSGEIRRLVHTRNVEHDYISETHASPSPDGSQIIWSSNWDKAGRPVSDYVARIDWP